MRDPEIPPGAPSRGRTLARAALVVAILMAVIAFYALGGAERLSWEEIQSQRYALQRWTEDHRFLAPLLFFLIYALVTSLAVPLGPPLSILAGALFERLLGSLLVSFASTVGASIAFLLSRYLFRDFVQRHWGTRLIAIHRGVERDGIYYLLALRLSPLVPYTLINLGMGLTRMPLRTFWWVSQLGMLPISFAFINAGAELRNVIEPQDILSPGLILSLSLVALVPLLGRLIWTWLSRRRRPSEQLR